MNAVEAKPSKGDGKLRSEEKKKAISRRGQSQDDPGFDLKLMTPSARTVKADVHFVTRSSSCVETGQICEAPPARICPLATAENVDDICATKRTSSDSDLNEYRRNDQSPREERRRKNGYASEVVSSPVPTSSSAGSRFKFPNVKMGAFLFRKKRSWPTLSGVAEGNMPGDQSPTLSAGDHGSMVNNNDHNKPSSSPADSVGGKNAGETNPLLFRRLNNRLRGRKMTTPAKPQVDFYQMTSLEEDVVANGPASCRLYSSDYSHHQSMAKRLLSKEDPGPSNVALITVAAVATTAAIVDEIGAIGGSGVDCASGTSGCNKSVSFPAAFDVCWDLGASSTPGAISSGAKYKLVKEGQIQVCRLNHPRTLLGKLTSSKLLRRWETHTLILGSDEICSKTVSSEFYEFAVAN